MVLLERENELSLLKKIADDCVNQQSSIVSIQGEAGIGKSSLVNHFLDALGNDFCICRGFCESLFTPRPFGPVYDMRSELVIDFPDSMDQDNKSVVFESFRKAIQSKARPVVLLFEDVHWADEATLDLIKFLGRRIEQFQCLLILTYRDNELGKTHPLTRVLAELASKKLQRVNVAPLSKEVVLELAANYDLSGERLYHLTKGNPFFVFTLLKSKSLEVSENLRDFIISGLYNVSSSEREILKLISLFPQKTEVETLGTISTITDVSDCIDSLVAKEFIQTDGIDIYFRHDLVRLAIYDSIYPIEKLNYHKKILSAILENSNSKIVLSNIVHHAIKSRNLQVIQKYAPKAALEASKWGAHIQAFNLYKIAIENIQDKYTEAHAELLEAFSYECYLTNHMSEGIKAAQSLIDIWSEVDPLKTGNAYMLSSRLYWFSGQGDKALLHGKKAIEILENCAPESVFLANSYAHYGHILTISFSLRQAYKWNNRTLDLSKTIEESNVNTFARSNNALLDIHNSLETYRNGLNNLKKSLNAAIDIKDQGLVGRIYVNLYFNYVLTGNIDVAQQIIGEIKKFFIDNDLDLFFYVIKSLESLMYRFKGDWPMALEIADDTLQSRHDNHYTSFAATFNKSIIMARVGDANALSFLSKGCELALQSRTYQFAVPMATAVLEYEWIVGEEFPDRSIIDFSLEMTKTHDSIWYDGLFNYWLEKRGMRPITKVGWTTSELSKYHSDLKETMSIWSMTIPYYKALQLCDGDNNDKKKAFDLLQGLGAKSTIKRLKKQLRAQGVKQIPRGIRPSTKNNPEQLTNRQLEILNLLKEGLTNVEIGDKLFISSKTVDNHVSAVLERLNAESRAKAVLIAREKGIIR